MPGRSVLRVHRHGYHTEPAIASELAWMDALRAEAGVRTPRVLAATDGRRVVTAADEASGERRNCVRFEFLPGTEPPEDSVEHFAELGEITARMHRHARQLGPPARVHPVRLGLRRGVRHARRAGGAGRTGSASARRNARCWGGSTPPCAPGWPRSAPARTGTASSTPTPGWPTCSWTTAGSASSTSTTRGFSWYLYDVGTSVSFFEHDPQVPELMDAWLPGYRRVAGLPAADEAEIWTFILFRRLLLVAWIGSHSGGGHRAGTRSRVHPGQLRPGRELPQPGRYALTALTPLTGRRQRKGRRACSHPSPAGQ